MSIAGFLKSILNNPALFSIYNTAIGASRSANIFVRQYARPGPGMRVLDIGCGTGRLTPYFKGTDYTGIDNAASYIEEARKACPWAKFILADLSTETLPDASADLVIIYGVLHHLDDAQCRGLLSQLARSLAPKGTLAIAEPAFAEGQSRFVRWMLANDRGNFVRWEKDYRELLSTDFTITEHALRHDLLTIPYTHTLYRAAPK